MHPSLIAEARVLLKEKLERQRGIPSYFDNWIARCLGAPGTDAQMAAMFESSLREFVHLSRQPRLQHWRERHAATQGRSFSPGIALTQSQGIAHIQQWKGLPMFKSAFDLAIYQQLLEELRPRHVLELGSGSGASAIWLRDMATALCGTEVDVVSVDIAPPAMVEPGIRFLHRDCRNRDEVAALLDSLDWDRPVLVIEDAHEGVAGMLELLHPWLTKGDYLIIEDSRGKQDIIAASAFATRETFAVDTRYLDLFGTNVTSCCDSIFVRTA
jgi:cephalosporin hydroxylase